MMRGMDVAMTLPTMLPHTRDQFVGWCRGIDEGPWSSLAVPERVTFTSHALTVQLSGAAALTERVRLWTTLIVLPAHDEVQVAKDMASVDVLCSGRLTLGVGVGGREQDYRAIGGDFTRRWARMDEQVARMRGIWAQEPPFEGSDPVGPGPVQSGGPPFVGGVVGPKAIARAARWAAGVNDPSSITSVDPVALAAQRGKVVQAWRDADRLETPHFSGSIWFALGPGARDRLREYVYRYLRIFDDGFARQLADSAPVHTADALKEAVDGAAEAGCDEFFLVPTTVDPAELERARDALGI
jgi:alkanesulfonate monooxygenase SsuD/methylene tetrahydromethanopterin reductase-like flavin-dependent oxidoreductase (luciferase family)